ncbi:MAG: hypothetical protein K2G10_05955, partial [Alistipes sp.]|nr:hypothetical protein [Alistipes sp.]
QLITNQLLWPTELHRQNQPFWIAKVGIKFLSRKYSAIIFSHFSIFLKEPSFSRFFRGETGCKDRKVFEYRNRLPEKYRPQRQRAVSSRPLPASHPEIPYI